VIRTKAPGVPILELPSEEKEGGRAKRRQELGIPTAALVRGHLNYCCA